ncbi:unnamed protein product [Phaeothamnion confervicola]
MPRWFDVFSWKLFILPVIVFMAFRTSRPSEGAVREPAFVASSSMLDAGTTLFTVERDGAAISWADAIASWQTSAPFRDCFIEALKSSPFMAFFWETVPLTEASKNRRFEFALTDATRGLARVEAEPEAFAEHIADGRDTDGVQSFYNLGRDAVLVVPCQNGPADNYKHLANFVRKAPPTQVHAFWEQVGSTVERTLGERSAQAPRQPTWVSTAGQGVYWLHVRLDTRPKYYKHDAFRRDSGAPPP